MVNGELPDNTNGGRMIIALATDQVEPLLLLLLGVIVVSLATKIKLRLSKKLPDENQKIN